MKKRSKRLTLNKSTIRSLNGNQLGAAAGGRIIIQSWWDCSEDCASGVPGCSVKCYTEAHLSCTQACAK